MKNKAPVLFIGLFIISLNCFTQVKKVYAYKQASIPGNIVRRKERTERKPNFNYWFYLSIPKKEKINVTGLWIDGKQYEIKQDSITDIPVKKIIYTGIEKNDTIIMVPATSNNVLLIYPDGIQKSDTKSAFNLSKTNELVIRYRWKNRTYYTFIKKIKELTPDVTV